MNLEYTHKPNYFFYAQLFIRHIETYIQKHPDVLHATFELSDIYDLFRQDYASSTTNLDSILNIADEYKVETLNSGDQKLITHYKIDAENNSLTIDFDEDAAKSLQQGKSLVAPDANQYE
ncbi:hypothetical protein [Acinetobacter baylyi]|uniref:Uncharacterized protein n=1 Tax=Acinetobacter baylyi (strain ATCC 33305 / BD413 / ADP1) TaxID=62977 RepID=Q6FE72_ACIAD|nr:hypothetical protein [Acinetobacter baylyi]ENV55773.1 hypothetical protein F952_00401 [Acinetobacter baylyi DSM 14961 = CIP 107474]KAF2371512.1 hypothetical protein BSL88_06285 [Acinetobacter baylyi]KAF2373461.1 hypothetical protein BSL67_10920 [Acinetobacter baylyi]KAF2376692.1 hypothetical protein BSN81_12420 [Acinetobacter baylyi]KAF2381444.1 hypothetical protein BSN83_06780 [Acinetobacter baylyi]